ncbi:MAG: hypothetical protein FVQ77_10520 [Cytophagales bacterium]|nr:hypothetical protein [Cytophagales bacterium]
MEFITSRGYKVDIPTDKKGMEKADWFNMWKIKRFPYYELVDGDTLYWLETKSQRLVWKTEVVSVDRYPYTDKKQVFARYKNSRGSGYYDNRADKGYFVGYKVKVIERIDIPKPKGYRFPQLGWLRIDSNVAQKWFDRNVIEDNNILDDFISSDKSSINKQLAELNQKMQNVSPDRIEKLVSTTIRKDTKIINSLKKIVDYKCQFTSCGHQIKKKNGGFYIEVAHIKSVAKLGQSILGNLIVLCPNHHKEFDYGQLSIHEQTATKISGQLNGRQFEIELTT